MAEAEPDFGPIPEAWRSAINTIKNIIDGGEAMELAKDLPEGPGSKLGLENYAREYCAAKPQADLALIYNILGVTTCTAAQGGYVLQVPLHGGGWLKVPVIQFAMGVAPSGFGKSTALDAGMVPLTHALRAGLAERRELLPVLKDAAILDWENQPNRPANVVANNEQFRAVYDAGLCPKTLTQDATPEALRNQAVNNGAHVSCLAGEPELFRAIGAYSKDNGSLSLLLNGWDQREIDTTRVGNSDLTIDEASMAICVLFQTAVFSEMTTGNMNGMGTGADNFTDRGMFGRFWLVMTEKTGDFVEIARSYSDDDDFDNNPNDLNGYTDSDGVLTPLGAAALDFENALRELQIDTNPYRVAKAIHRAWGMASTKYGTDMQPAEPPRAEREVILLDDDGRLAYRRLQRMMSEISYHIEHSEDEDNKRLWNPLATRITQHVLREALVVSLAAGRRTVSAELIEDAACRILPWRWCHTARVLTQRANERAEDIMAEVVLKSNPTSRDISPTSLIQDALFKLAQEDRSLVSPGLPMSKLRDKLRSRLPRQHKNVVGTLLKKELPLLIADPESGIRKVEGPRNAVGHSTEHYTVAAPVRF